MVNEAHISLSGYVATQPRWRGRDTQYPNLTMRVAWTPRRLDRATGEWTDGHTSYASVYCWRKLADNAATCLRKGDPVVVRGRLSVREYTAKDGTPRTEVEVAATALGHDLNRGVAQFARIRPVAGKTADELAAGDGEDAPDGAGLDTAVLDRPDELDGPEGARPPGEMFDAAAIDDLAADQESVPTPF